MEFLHAILLILGGILALSAFIVTKRPDAKAMIDKLTPFQAFIGVGLLVISLIQLLDVGPINAFRILSLVPLLGITIIGACYGGIILGFFFGMPQIAKWIPGDSNAETKATNLAKKLAPFQMIFGIIALVAGVLLLLFRLNILKPF
ncbi:MAG: hypothetical protein M3680_17365 [Myxococcota bacterium]|nr:hypothetical protein [Myxococcota bacterium]